MPKPESKKPEQGKGEKEGPPRYLLEISGG